MTAHKKSFHENPNDLFMQLHEIIFALCFHHDGTKEFTENRWREALKVHEKYRQETIK
jgi:hypothetical protein